RPHAGGGQESGEEQAFRVFQEAEEEDPVLADDLMGAQLDLLTRRGKLLEDRPGDGDVVRDAARGHDLDPIELAGEESTCDAADHDLVTPPLASGVASSGPAPPRKQ